MCTTGSDIDILCVVTNQITRAAFFHWYGEILSTAVVTIDIDIVCLVGSPTVTRLEFVDRYSELLSGAGFSIVNVSDMFLS